MFPNHKSLKRVNFPKSQKTGASKYPKIVKHVVFHFKQCQDALPLLPEKALHGKRLLLVQG